MIIDLPNFDFCTHFPHCETLNENAIIPEIFKFRYHLGSSNIFYFEDGPIICKF